MRTFFSPAKINFFLRILKKRSDGYHEIASLFQTIDLGDLISFSFAEKDLVSSSDPILEKDPSNLVVKARDLYRKKTNSHFPVAIHLEKRIPIGAGLGGGSSNAATTLWALNALNQNLVPESELQNWSAELGSDVPFFFSHGTAFCRGRGEEVMDLPSLSFDMPLILHKPKEGISTPEVYKCLKLEECSQEDPEKLLQKFYSKDPYFVNDLERPAMRLLPILKEIKDSLAKKNIYFPTMTGSGTAFFGFEKKAKKPVSEKKISLISRKPHHWYSLTSL